jgi:hypothetical protein
LSHLDPKAVIQEKSKKSKSTRRTFEEIFKVNSTYNRCALRRRVIKDSLLPYKCDKCGIDKWDGQQLSLHLDHINGITTDNRLENLRFLCPNCHSLTPTYCKIKDAEYNKERKFCCDCGEEIFYSSLKCKKCNGKNRLGRNTKIDWPPIEDLELMIKESNWSVVGRKLGVSVAAIKKHIRKRKMPP